MVFRKCKFRVRIYLRTMKASSEKIIVHLYFYILFGSLLVQFTKSYDAYKALALGADAVSVGRGILTPLLHKVQQALRRK